MTSSIDYRKASPADARPISRLILSLVDYFVAELSDPRARSFLADLNEEAIARQLKDSSFSCFTAYIDGDLKGVIALSDTTHVHYLFVAGPSQHQGIARDLWIIAKNEAFANKVIERFTVNSSVFAVPVYEAFGFRQTADQIENNGVVSVPMLFDLHAAD